MRSNVAGLLTYLLPPISGVLLLFAKRNDAYVRYHAKQAIGFGILEGVAGAVAIGLLNIGANLSTLGAIAIFIVTFILWVILMIKAYKGERFRLWVLGSIAEEWVNESPQIGWRFWLKWVSVSTAALLIASGAPVYDYGFGGFGTNLSGAVISALYQTLGGAFAGIIIGAFVGALQWIVLQRQVPWASRWVWASAVGWAIGYAVAWPMNLFVRAIMLNPGDITDTANIVRGVGSYAVVGFVVGIVHWRMLRHEVYRIVWLVFGSTVGYSLFGAGVYANPSLLGLVLVLVGPVLAAFITGTFLVWLLQRPDPQASI